MKKYIYIFFLSSGSFFYAHGKEISVENSDETLIVQKGGKNFDKKKEPDRTKKNLTEDIIEDTFEKTIHWGWKKIEPWWKKRYVRYSIYGLVAFKFFVPTIMSVISVTRGWTSDKNGASNPVSLAENVMKGVSQSLESEKFKKLAEQYGYIGGQAFISGVVDQLQKMKQKFFENIKKKLFFLDFQTVESSDFNDIRMIQFE